MINGLKNLLLDTGYFKDNDYLKAYISLLSSHEENENSYGEQHHIIPAAVYRYKFSCKNGVEARKLADADEKNTTVLLLYKDHILAHYFLYFCTSGKVKRAMAQAATCMIGNLDVTQLDFSEFHYLPEQFNKIQQLIDHIHADPDNSFYTPYEVEFLKLHYGAMGPAYCAEQLNRPLGSVTAKANRLRLHRDSYRPWTAEEKQIIVQYYESCGPDYCHALLIDRDKNSICGQARMLGLQCGRRYSIEEEQFLIENYSKLGGKKCAEMLDRDYASLRMKAKKLGLIGGNPWTSTELALLKENYHKGAEYCATLINRSPAVITTKAHDSGLSRTRPKWSAEEIEFLKQNYEVNGLSFCAEALINHTYKSIAAQASKLGLSGRNKINKNST